MQKSCFPVLEASNCVTIVSLVSENFKNTIPVLMAFKDENWWKTDPSDEAVQ